MGALKARSITYWIFSLLILTSSTLVSQDGFEPVANSTRLMERLNENASGIETIQSAFTQKKALTFLDEVIISEGFFWFKKDNQLRWAYHEPFDYVILINKGKFTIRDGDQVSAYDMDSNPAFSEINKLIVNMVKGNITDDGFEISAFEDPGLYLVRLVPRDPLMAEVISTMEIYFSRTDLSVAKVIMKESEQDYTLISFTDKQINAPIDDQVFSVDY